MAWTKNHHSRGEIDRAGDVLKADFKSVNFNNYLHAYNIMNTWRSSHAFPLNTLQITLRNRSRNIDRNSIIVQRMKRASSVIQKLRRYQDMRLSRMQDLGGARSIVRTVENIYDLRRMYKESRDRHRLANEKDYIASPQESGYRGYHIIYKYNSDRSNEYNNHRIEIQLRTKIQHAWATAVEIAGVYVQSSLKSSIGPKDWLDFFKYASSAFSIIEGTDKLHGNLSDNEVKNTLSCIDKRINATERLKNFSFVSDFARQKRRRSDSHFLFILDIENSSLEVWPFSKLTPATERYAEVERKYTNKPLVDTVLVSADSFESVLSAYPNYFADTKEFISLMDKFLDPR